MAGNKTTVQELIAGNRTAEAIKILKIHTSEDNQLHNELLIIESKFRDFESQLRSGTERPDNLGVAKRQVDMSLLQITDLVFAEKEKSELTHSNDQQLRNRTGSTQRPGLPKPGRRSQFLRPLTMVLFAVLFTAGAYLFYITRPTEELQQPVALSSDTTIRRYNDSLPSEERKTVKGNPDPATARPTVPVEKKPAQLTYSFSGIVAEGSGGAVIPAAEVWLNGQLAGQTDEAGRFDLSLELESSRDVVEILFLAPGYQSFSKDVELPAVKTDGRRINIGAIKLENKKAKE